MPNKKFKKTTVPQKKLSTNAKLDIVLENQNILIKGLLLIIKNQKKMDPKLEQLKTDLQEANTKLDAQDAKFDELGNSLAGVQTDLAKLDQTIKDLQAAGGAPSQADLDELAGLSTSMKTKIDNITTKLGNVAQQASDEDNEHA